MIDAKQAVDAATAYFVGLTGIEADRVRLEEVESGRDSKRDVWRITLSRPNSEVFEFVRGRPARDYKLITIDKKTGRVVSMKIREVVNA